MKITFLDLKLNRVIFFFVETLHTYICRWIPKNLGQTIDFGCNTHAVKKQDSAGKKVKYLWHFQ